MKKLKIIAADAAGMDAMASVSGSSINNVAQTMNDVQVTATQPSQRYVNNQNQTQRVAQRTVRPVQQQNYDTPDNYLAPRFCGTPPKEYGLYLLSTGKWQRNLRNRRARGLA